MTLVTTSVPDTQVVAAVQFEPKILKVQENVATAQQLAFEAAGKGARVIVLPELCMSGLVLSGVREAADVAQTRDGWQTQAMIEVAKQMNCHIVFGYVELTEGKLYNSAAVVSPGGLEATAQKHNLAGSDNLWAQPSDQFPPVVVTPAGRMGVLICRDAMNKYRESYEFYQAGHRFYKKGSVDTIALLTNWGSGYNYPDTNWVELAESTKANVIVSNRIGEERDMSFKGGSCVIDRDRRIWTHGSTFDSNAVVGGVVVL
jgi:predicted amidohydrolase